MENDIKEFMEKFKLEYNGKSRQLPKDIQAFRLRTLYEEINEYIEAIHDDNLEEAFDALVDLVYFAIGTAYLHGFPFKKGWDRVHAANMKKVRAKRNIDSKRNSSYDVVKPEGWQAPILKDLLED